MLRKMCMAFVALTLVSGVALADDSLLLNSDMIQHSGAFTMSPGLDLGPEATLYTSNVETGSRFDPTAANTATANPTPITYDDVPIPNARLGGATSINVTKVTVGIRRLANAPAVTVGLFYSTFANSATAPDTVLNTPGTSAGSTALVANGAASVTQLVVFGDGINTLFTTSLNTTLIPGFSTFALGVSLAHAADPSSLNGWRITSGPDANADNFWVNDTAHATQPNDEGQYYFGGNPVASFYIILEGSPVPEPTTLSVAGLALAGLAMRRRSR